MNQSDQEYFAAQLRKLKEFGETAERELANYEELLVTHKDYSFLIQRFIVPMRERYTKIKQLHDFVMQRYNAGEAYGTVLDVAVTYAIPIVAELEEYHTRVKRVQQQAA